MQDIWQYINTCIFKENSSGACTAHIQLSLLVCPQPQPCQSDGQGLLGLVGLFGWAFGLPTAVWVLA